MMYGFVQSLHCRPETNVTVHMSYTSINYRLLLFGRVKYLSIDDITWTVMAWPEFQKGDSGSIRTDGWRVKRLDTEIRNDVGHGDGHNVMGISDTRKADYIIVGAQ